jgi:L-galactose dehydrogenase
VPEQNLERRTLGRTGIEVTAMGFGAGGFSRAGLDGGVDHAASVIAQAIDSGINLIDTAEMYRTEPAAAAGIARSSRSRGDVVIATKIGYRTDDRLRTPDEIEAAIRTRLEALQTEYVDVLQVHGLQPEHYGQVRDELLPVLERQRDAGTLRWIGVTEGFRVDRAHDMLARAIPDGCWDVVMVGFNLLNQTARERVLQPAIEANVGVMDMFAVRQALRDLERVSAHLRDFAAAGIIPPDVDVERAIAALASHVGDGAAAPTLPDLAYRFVRAEPGISTVLVGTGNPDHLRDNLASFARPPLDPAVFEELRGILAGVSVLNGEDQRPSFAPAGGLRSRLRRLIGRE